MAIEIEKKQDLSNISKLKASELGDGTLFRRGGDQVNQHLKMSLGWLVIVQSFMNDGREMVSKEIEDEHK